MLRKWGTLVLLMLALPVLALAQNSGKVAGKVVDAETGEPLPGASVAIEGTTLGSSTDINGNYTIFEVPPGIHTIIAQFVGFTTVRRENVEVIGGITTRANFEMSPGTLELEVVEVTAERPLVNPTATNAVRRLGREEFEKLPTRSAQTYYAIQPGVTLQNGEIYIRGGRPDETNYLLEGISSRSVMGTDNVIPVIPEALEEVQVYAGGYSAEFGNANAGIVQQVLRSGGPQLSALVQYETDGVADAFADTYSYGYDDLTVTLGGPLVWDKHRFFVAVNYQDMDDNAPMYWYGADFGRPVDEIRGDTAVAALAWGDGNVPGLQRPQEQLRVNGTMSFNFHPLRIRLGFAQVTGDRRLNALPLTNLYNQERIGQRDDFRRLWNAQASYFLSDRTYVEGTLGFFQYNFENYDPLFDTPDADGAGGAVLDLVDYYSRDAVGERFDDAEMADLYTRFWRDAYTTPAVYTFNGFNFNRPGAPTTTYRKREQGYVNLGLNLTSQQENHELKAGGHYQKWTVRNFAMNARALASTIQNNPDYADQIRQETDAIAADIRRTGAGGFGYDEFMNEVDDGPDGAKQPVTAAMYVNDKIEYNDIIVNAGLRWDYFDMDLFTIDDLTAPNFDKANWTVTDLKKADGHGVIQPRLGLSFPVTERTVFHLQYGKFAQMPDLSFAYASRSFMATVLGGQNFISAPFSFDLEPIKTTQYEVGLGHQFNTFAAFDVTAFYRKTEGQIEITQVKTNPAATQAGDYNLFVNGDFSIARGLEFTLRTRRVGNFMAMMNYTLTDAKGTNSEPGGQVSALENGTAPPSLIQPLTFEQRHRGSIMLDYRTSPEASTLLQNISANVLFQFNSGHRYTASTGSFGQRGADDGPLLTDGDPRNRIPLEPLNSSTTPWFFNTDLRLEKGFSVSTARATAYMYVENLFNTKNILNVYLRTGDADSDGFLSNPELSEQIVSGRGPEYVAYYNAINLLNRQHYIGDQGNDLFATPRQVRLGVRVEL